MTLREKAIAYKTIVVREFLRFIRIWIQTVLPPVIMTALYFIIFGNLIGPRIGDMAGIRYMDYIVPGLIMMAVITNSYANVVSSFYGSKFQHNIEEMLVSPMPNYIILAGYVTGGVARGVIVGIAVTIVSMMFSDLKVYDVFVIVSTVFLTAVLFSLAGFVNGVFANSFDDITMLSEFWQKASMANPILYMVNTFRYGFLGITDINLVVAYSIIIGFVVALYLFSLHLLKIGYGIRQ